MKSFSHRGHVLPLIAPYAVASGAPFKVGVLVAVAVAAAANGAPIEGMTEGVFVLPKVTAQAWNRGDRIYWDDAAKLMTTVSTNNTLVGACSEPALNPSTTGTVYLDGAVR